LVDCLVILGGTKFVEPICVCISSPEITVNTTVGVVECSLYLFDINALGSNPGAFGFCDKCRMMTSNEESFRKPARKKFKKFEKSPSAASANLESKANTSHHKNEISQRYVP
jgi:hypothetical protein